MYSQLFTRADSWVGIILVCVKVAFGLRRHNPIVLVEVIQRRKRRTSVVTLTNTARYWTRGLVYPITWHTSWWTDLNLSNRWHSAQVSRFSVVAKGLVICVEATTSATQVNNTNYDTKDSHTADHNSGNYTATQTIPIGTISGIASRACGYRCGRLGYSRCSRLRYCRFSWGWEALFRGEGFPGC